MLAFYISMLDTEEQQNKFTYIYQTYRDLPAAPTRRRSYWSDTGAAWAG